MNKDIIKAEKLSDPVDLDQSNVGNSGLFYIGPGQIRTKIDGHHGLT